MIKVLAVFGTRPEAIKMCPLIIELKKRSCFKVVTCVSGQHRELLDDVLPIFGVEVDYDLKIMEKAQTLFDITERILNRIEQVIQAESPDIVLVHGDTSTAFATAIAAFYKKIPIGHVEAGLRSSDIFEPYPEEFNRRAISLISDLDFAPTRLSMKNLIKEGKDINKVFVTGNTVVDALKYTLTDDKCVELFDDRTVLLTMHRKENVGDPMRSVASALRRVARLRPDVKIIIPLHPSPLVRKIICEELAEHKSITLCEPLDVVSFHKVLKKCKFVLTDSGGVQEEGIALGKPVLVLRNKTERPEGIYTGGLKVIGTNEDNVFRNVMTLLDDKEEYKKMLNAENPYGDGRASERIADIIEKFFST